MPRQAMRKRLNASGLLALSRQCFERIGDGTPVRAYRLVDCLMLALAMFGLKSPSLLQFDREVRLDGRVRGNLLRLVDRVPCDTQIRTRLDRVPASALRPPAGLVVSRIFCNFQWERRPAHMGGSPPQVPRSDADTTSAFGKILTTRVRRRSSSLYRSSMFVDFIRR